jgi:MDMPI-like protein
VHTYDAQVTVGAPQPLPRELALDGVDEFLTTRCAGTEPWPRKPVVVDYHATEGRSWRLWVSDGRTHTAQLPYGATADEPADVAVWGTAHELVMFFYGRILVESLRTEGDQGILVQLHV